MLWATEQGRDERAAEWGRIQPINPTALDRDGCYRWSRQGERRGCRGGGCLLCVRMVPGVSQADMLTSSCRNWCAYVVTRTVSCVVEDGVESFVKPDYQPCGWGQLQCPRVLA